MRLRKTLTVAAVAVSAAVAAFVFKPDARSEVTDSPKEPLTRFAKKAARVLPAPRWQIKFLRELCHKKYGPKP